MYILEPVDAKLTDKCFFVAPLASDQQLSLFSFYVQLSTTSSPNPTSVIIIPFPIKTLPSSSVPHHAPILLSNDTTNNNLVNFVDGIIGCFPFTKPLNIEGHHVLPPSSSVDKVDPMHDDLTNNNGNHNKHIYDQIQHTNHITNHTSTVSHPLSSSIHEPHRTTTDNSIHHPHHHSLHSSYNYQNPPPPPTNTSNTTHPSLIIHSTSKAPVASNISLTWITNVNDIVPSTATGNGSTGSISTLNSNVPNILHQRYTSYPVTNYLRIDIPVNNFTVTNKFTVRCVFGIIHSRIQHELLWIPSRSSLRLPHHHQSSSSSSTPSTSVSSSPNKGSTTTERTTIPSNNHNNTTTGDQPLYVPWNLDIYSIGTARIADWSGGGKTPLETVQDIRHRHASGTFRSLDLPYMEWSTLCRSTYAPPPLRTSYHCSIDPSLSIVLDNNNGQHDNEDDDDEEENNEDKQKINSNRSPTSSSTVTLQTVSPITILAPNIPWKATLRHKKVVYGPDDDISLRLDDGNVPYE